jgi:alpha/beta superfamily hydrolase
MADALTVASTGDVMLEAEVARAAGARLGVVLCHPHPQYGGTMRSIVIGALFEALPAVGATCLRFNFRGVEGSTGTYDNGRGEADDARAALHAMESELAPGTPIVMIGWSFGGDIALSVLDPEVRAWIAIAPPLRFAPTDQVGPDPRPKLLLLGEHDEIRPPDEVVEVASGWAATEVEVVPGASHFFVGRTDRLVASATDFLGRLPA